MNSARRVLVLAFALLVSGQSQAHISKDCLAAITEHSYRQAMWIVGTTVNKIDPGGENPYLPEMAAALDWALKECVEEGGEQR